MQTVSVQVPQGSFPGQQLDINVGGARYRVTIPAGCFAGATFQAQVPVGAQQPSQPRQMSVTVPAGVGPGQMLSIRTPEGNLVQVQVPANCGPGSSFIVALR